MSIGDDLEWLALESSSTAAISSMCTVFAESEVISLRAHGIPKEDIAAGLVESIARRVAAMARPMGLKEHVALVGGVAKNPAIRALLERELGTPIKGATVTVTDRETNKAYSGTSNDNGVFSILVPNGYYGIAVRATGYEASFLDNNGAGYRVMDSSLYVGYVPVAAVGASGSLNGVRLSSDFPGKSVKVNESVSFDVRITNNGIVDKTYVLSVSEAPPGWNVQLLSGGDVINRVFVGSKSSQSFQVRTIPLGEGSSVITIMAGSGDDKGQLQLYVDAARDADYRLELTVPEDVSLSAGESRNVEAIVRNNGSAVLSNVMLSIGQDDVPRSLTATVQTRAVDRLEPGQSQRFVIQVYAKADAGTGSDKLYMRAVSAEAKTEQKYMTVSYSTSNTWLGMGIAIALIAILAFGFILWKYGRR